MYVRNRQNVTDMDTKRATIKCIATALVCQLCGILLVRPISYRISETVQDMIKVAIDH